MATQREVEAVSEIFRRWAENKGVGNYVSQDEKTELAIEVIEKIDELREK